MDAQISRLLRRPSYLQEITEDCWRRAGLCAGMRVLNAGCGEGESAFVAASIVGRDGSVVGFDRDHQRLRQARKTADSMWVENVQFCDYSVGASLAEAAYGLAPFDAVVGRLYLALHDDPAAELRQLAKLVRPGGVLAFVEVELDYGHRTDPAVPLVDQAVGWVQAGYREFGAHMHMVTGMARAFLEAGLGWPSMRAYQGAFGAGSDELYRGIAATLEELMPVLHRATRKRREDIGVETLADRLAAAVLERGGAAAWPPTAGGWARVA